MRFGDVHNDMLSYSRRIRREAWPAGRHWALDGEKIVAIEDGKQYEADIQETRETDWDFYQPVQALALEFMKEAVEHRQKAEKLDEGRNSLAQAVERAELFCRAQALEDCAKRVLTV